MVDLSEYRGIFLEELDEQLQLIEDEVLRLEQIGRRKTEYSNSSGQPIPSKASASMGYNRLKEVTHHLEHLLHQMRNGERQVTDELIRLFFQALDGMRALQSEIAAADHETTDVSELIQRLKTFGAQGLHGHDRGPAVQPNKTETPLQLFWLHVWLSPACEMKLPRLHLIDAKLRDLATVLRMKPELEEIEAHDSRVDGASWMLSPKRNIEELRQQISSIMDVESIYIEEVKDISLNPAAEKSGAAGTGEPGPPGPAGGTAGYC